jgi:6-pyruvoyltetrahydropterin/6-carboxytetrahydropterin synthase
MAEWIIYKEFRFEAAHRLPHYEGKCRRLHGHSWLGRVYVKSHYLQSQGSQQGMVMDFGEIKFSRPSLSQ